MTKRQTALAVLALAACGEAAPAPEPPTAFNLDGMILAGMPEDAKKSGFTECEENSLGFSCSTTGGTTILGVPAKRVHALLTWEIGDEERQNANSRYKYVTADFQPVTIDYACRAEGDKYACAVDQSLPLVTLERKLVENGWLATHRRWGTEYYNTQQPYVISVNDGRTGMATTEVTFTPESKEAIMEVVNEEKAERANHARRAAETANFVDGMKSP